MLTVEETRDLVFQVGVPLNLLDGIANYRGENQKQHYVQKWLDMDTDASWDKLVAGLRKIDKNSLANEIESVEQSNSSIKRIKSSLSYMNPKHFISHCKLYVWYMNRERVLH